MPPLTIVAKVIAKKESVETVKAELFKLIAPTRKEDGCLEYTLHQDNEDPAVFIFYENWESEACLAGHMVSNHFKNYVRAVGELLEEKIIQKMSRIEPGGES
jgi:quinol monooxygenase YgiN